MKYAIIVAGGTGTRMESVIPKQFINIGNLPILMHTLLSFYTYDQSVNILLVLPENQVQFWNELCKKYDFIIKHTIVLGGKTRFESVSNGLNAIENLEGLVAIHDGVRPFLTSEIIEHSYQMAEQLGNAITAVKSKDSIRIENPDNTTKTLDRNKIFIIQTPQTFQIARIKQAYLDAKGTDFTDDASVLESFGDTIFLINGTYSNIKITTPEDLLFGEVLLNQNQSAS